MGDKQKIPRRRRGGFWSENFYFENMMRFEDVLVFGSRGGWLFFVAVNDSSHT